MKRKERFFLKNKSLLTSVEIKLNIVKFVTTLMSAKTHHHPRKFGRDILSRCIPHVYILTNKIFIHPSQADLRGERATVAKEVKNIVQKKKTQIT